MKLSSNLILFVALPALVVVVSVASWVRVVQRDTAIQRAQTAIEETTAAVAERIGRDTTTIDRTLKSVLETLDGPLVPGGPEALRLAALCQAVLKNHPELLGIELSHGASKLVFSLTAEGATTFSVSAADRARLLAPQRTGIGLVWRGNQLAQLVRFGTSQDNQPAPALIALLDVQALIAPAAALASRLHPGSWVEFCSPDWRSTYSTLAKPHTGTLSLLTASRYLQQPTHLGSLRITQPQALALAADAEDRLSAFSGMAVTIVMLLTVLAISLSRTILRPVKKLMETVAAFERGEALPEAPTRRRDELGSLATSLRSALVGVSESHGRLQQMNSQLESRVAERTGQLRRYTRELRHARTETDGANKARAEFLANISHEVRTPLNGIIGMTELLLDSELNGEQNEYTQAIQRAGNEMLRLMTDVLDFSVLKRRQFELEESDFPLATAVNKICSTFAEKAERKGLTLSCEVDEALPKIVSGDNERLGQILTHLLDNGIKFTEQGSITLRVTQETSTEAALGLRFEIQDTGIGIPEEARQRLFEPFTQEDTSSTRRYGGAGIGLAMCQLLVEALGGSIGVRNAEGGGSTFWFTTVFKQISKDNISETRGRALLNGLRVLVVDDSSMNRTIFSRECKGWGMAPAEAESGAQAVALASSAFAEGNSFDLVLLDMQMPDMNGLQTARRFKQDPALADIPLVMLSSASSMGGRTEDQAAGIAARLIKPIHQQQLLSCLTRLMADAQAQALREPVSPEAPTPTPSRSRCRRVLIVEDNLVNQKVALRLLSKLGYEADVANHGAEAVEAVTERSYGAVLMDCQMPVMDGFEATREIRRTQGNGERVPILAMTANGLVSDRKIALSSGMDDYISKPVMADELRDMLNRWIEPETGEGSRSPTGAAEKEQPAPAVSQMDQPMSSPDSPSPLSPSEPSEPSADNGQPAIDESVLEELRSFQCDDGPDILTELIDIFLEDTPPRLAAMSAAMGTSESAVAEAEGHALKSSCAQLGALGLSEICRQIEQAGKVDSIATARPLVEEALIEFRRVEQALLAMRQVS